MNFSRQELLAIIRSVAYVATSDDEVPRSEYDYMGNLVRYGFNTDVDIINEGMEMSQYQTFQILYNMSDEKKREVLKMWIGMMNADGIIRQSEIDTIKLMCNQMSLFDVDIDSLCKPQNTRGSGKFQRLAKPINLGGTSWKSTDGKYSITFDNFSMNGSEFNGEFAIYSYNSTTKRLEFIIDDMLSCIRYRHEFKVLSLTSDKMELEGKNGIINLHKQ